MESILFTKGETNKLCFTPYTHHYPTQYIATKREKKKRKLTSIHMYGDASPISCIIYNYIILYYITSYLYLMAYFIISVNPLCYFWCLVHVIKIIWFYSLGIVISSFREV